jgi:DNA-binding XRE family transcriptional regulator
MAKKLKLIPFSEIEKEWMKDPEFRRIRKEREPYFRIVKQLTEARIRQKKTQAEVARKAGLTQEAISALESLKREPQLSTLCKVAMALGVKVLKIS